MNIKRCQEDFQKCIIKTWETGNFDKCYVDLRQCVNDIHKKKDKMQERGKELRINKIQKKIKPSEQFTHKPHSFHKEPWWEDPFKKEPRWEDPFKKKKWNYSRPTDDQSGSFVAGVFFGVVMTSLFFLWKR